jgi:CRP-like cAMP-binding protein
MLRQAGLVRARTHLFEHCPPIFCAKASYKKNEMIYAEGEEAASVYKVVSGAVRVQKDLSGGCRQIIAFHLPGDLFGFGTSSFRSFTAKAITKTEVLEINRHTLERLAKRNVTVGQRLRALRDRDLDRAQELLWWLGRKSAPERVAAFLNEMSQRMRSTGYVSLPMTRRDIADHLGLREETVSRAVTQLKAQGMIRCAKSEPRAVTLAPSGPIVEAQDGEKTPTAPPMETARPSPRAQ